MSASPTKADLVRAVDRYDAEHAGELRELGSWFVDTDAELIRAMGLLSIAIFGEHAVDGPEGTAIREAQTLVANARETMDVARSTFERAGILRAVSTAATDEEIDAAAE